LGDLQENGFSGKLYHTPIVAVAPIKADDDIVSFEIANVIFSSAIGVLPSMMSKVFCAVCVVLVYSFI